MPYPQSLHKKKERLISQAKRDGSQCVELPAKVVWIQKPDKHECRIVACGNQTHMVAHPQLTLTHLRYILYVCLTSSRDNALGFLDITTAFLNTSGLLYLYPQGTASKASLTEYTTYSDSSFAPGGRES